MNDAVDNLVLEHLKRFDAILTRLEPLKVFEHEVVNCVVHFSPSIFVRANWFNRFIAAGAIAFKSQEPPWPIPLESK